MPTPIEAIVDLPLLAEWLTLQTQTARSALSAHLQEWDKCPNRLQDKSRTAHLFQTLYVSHPTLYSELRSHFSAFAAIEKDMTTLWDATTDLERESYGELLFLRPLLQPLNAISFVLPLWSLLRVYLLPGMSLLLPLLALLAPYFILTYVICLPITFQNYISILHSMLSGQMADPSCPSSAPTSPPSSLLKQLAIVLVTLVQSIIQPYWTYKHLRAIQDTVKQHGQHLMEFRTRYEIVESRLRAHGFPVHRCPLPPFLSHEHAVSEAILHPMYFRLALKYIGALEVHVELYHHTEIHPVQWVSSPEPVFHLHNTTDLHVPAPQRKSFSVELGPNRRHALLTGPNKGGKSTVLRALSLSALLAHTYGCAVGHLTATPFQALCVCLKPDDLPGTKSRFEREIEFTAQTLHYTGPILVFLDELYHSTNPPDALSSCIHYTKRLWNAPQTISVISTHLFDWVEQAPAEIQRLCCPAHESPSGVQFTYSLQPGVCKVSSVGMLLEQNGL
jgi:hypothetical protein